MEKYLSCYGREIHQEKARSRGDSIRVSMPSFRPQVLAEPQRAWRGTWRAGAAAGCAVDAPGGRWASSGLFWGGSRQQPR